MRSLESEAGHLVSTMRKHQPQKSLATTCPAHDTVSGRHFPRLNYFSSVCPACKKPINDEPIVGSSGGRLMPALIEKLPAEAGAKA
jgi:hypothetical protein